MEWAKLNMICHDENKRTSYHHRQPGRNTRMMCTVRIPSLPACSLLQDESQESRHSASLVAKLGPSKVCSERLMPCCWRSHAFCKWCGSSDKAQNRHAKWQASSWHQRETVSCSPVHVLCGWAMETWSLLTTLPASACREMTARSFDCWIAFYQLLIRSGAAAMTGMYFAIFGL